MILLRCCEEYFCVEIELKDTSPTSKIRGRKATRFGHDRDFLAELNYLIRHTALFLSQKCVKVADIALQHLEELIVKD
jgi:hypothetical protein